jgi:DNA-binding response OmpR family regulator
MYIVSARRILVVEDHVDSAEMMAEVLRDEGHEVFLAFDATSALQIAGTESPSLVLLDIGLPGIDGYEVARRLREAGVTERIVALTGYSAEADRARALASGIDEHLVKPIDLAQLIAIAR